MTLASCSAYKQNIMFKPGDGFTGARIEQAQVEAEKNYVIQVNDLLNLEVYSNQGEKLVDPNGALINTGASTTNNPQATAPITYLVTSDGAAKLPLVGIVPLGGLSLRAAEELLQKEYNTFYKECFVKLGFANKRVVVLGAVGGQVIPLTQANMRLTEVLALAKGIPTESKAKDIRVIRGNEVFLIDFSTIEGLQKGNLLMEPNDIVYVEPVRRPFIEAFRDFATVSSLIVSIGTLVVIILSTNNSN